MFSEEASARLLRSLPETKSGRTCPVGKTVKKTILGSKGFRSIGRILFDRQRPV